MLKKGVFPVKHVLNFILVFLGISKGAEVQLKHPKEEAGLAEGVDLILKCHAEGNPEPHFEWYKNKIR